MDGREEVWTEKRTDGKRDGRYRGTDGRTERGKDGRKNGQISKRREDGLISYKLNDVWITNEETSIRMERMNE